MSKVSVLKQMSKESLSKQMSCESVLKQKQNGVKQKMVEEKVQTGKNPTGEGTREQKKILEQFKDVFKGLGCIKGVEYDIKMKADGIPVVNPPRRVPHALKSRLKEALDKLVQDGVLAQVEEPTEWVNSCVVVEKSNGKLRVCLDPEQSNYERTLPNEDC